MILQQPWYLLLISRLSIVESKMILFKMGFDESQPSDFQKGGINYFCLAEYVIAFSLKFPQPWLPSFVLTLVNLVRRVVLHLFQFYPFEYILLTLFICISPLENYLRIAFAPFSNEIFILPY